MNTIDHYVRLMREAEDDAARAKVLLTAPVFTLMRWRDVFVSCCRRAAFGEGETYLDALHDTLAKERHRGNLSGTMPMAGATATLIGIMERAAA